MTRYTNRRKRRDTNHAEIVEALRKAGYAVLDLSQVGGSCPDLLVAGAKHGCQVLMELKSAGEQLTAEQHKFAQGWPGTVVLVRSAEEAIKAMKLEMFP